MITDGDITYPEMSAVPGWHIDCRPRTLNRIADIDALSAYEVDPEPTTPYHEFL